MHCSVHNNKKLFNIKSAKFILKKTVLITGGNRGIGFETALQLGKKQFHVIVSGRNEDKLHQAAHHLTTKGISIDILLMDVNNMDSISQAAKSLASKQLKLDVLINNAAILLPEDLNLLKDDVSILRQTIETNCYGPLAVIRSFLPSMNQPGRIINISSEGGSMTEPVGGWSPAYCVSKTMLNGITRHIAYELSGQNISVNALDPGWTKTDMGGSAAPRSVEKAAATPVWLASEASQEMTGKFFRDQQAIPW